MEGFSYKELDRAFKPEEMREILVGMIRDFAQKNGVKKVVLGISGGKDSTVAAALCARALGKDAVYGIMLPDGTQKDIGDSQQVCKAMGIHNYTVNIGEAHKALKAAALEGTGDLFDAQSKAGVESDINVGPRLRMTTLRYVAQAIGAFLCGTGNLSEATVGYCTKDGDTSSDFNPLGRLTSKEVVAVGLTMEELPKELVEKAPTDGLSGKTDEERLGVTYQQIHDFIRLDSCGDAAVDEIIAKKWRGSAHKRRMPSVLDPYSGKVI